MKSAVTKKTQACIGSTLFLASLALAFSTSTFADKEFSKKQFPKNPSFTTLITAPYITDSIAADDKGNLYAPTRNVGLGIPCPIYRINLNNPSLVIVGYLPTLPTTQCNATGVAFDKAGVLYVGDQNSGQVMQLTPNDASPPTATPFATGVQSANGIAFDVKGNLWIADGLSNQGRVWRVPPTGGPGELQFRIQPMRNSVALGGLVTTFLDGVGRQIRSYPLGNSANNLGETAIVANGLAFNQEGDLIVSDTTRGALWEVKFNKDGTVKSPMNCDTTFDPKTLCMDSLMVADPRLEGADGIALDREGNIWSTIQARNAIVIYSKDGTITEFFRNPANAQLLRNSGNTPEENRHILEFPTNLFFIGNKLCISQNDTNSRDNSPNSGGEVDATSGPLKGKISCLDQALKIPGLPLPVSNSCSVDR